MNKKFSPVATGSTGQPKKNSSVYSNDPIKTGTTGGKAVARRMANPSKLQVATGSTSGYKKAQY